MNTNPNLVTQLRTLFLDGTTPSRLMQFILVQHPEESKGDKYRLIQYYFEKAFGISFIRILRREESYRIESLRYAHFNEGLMHQIVEIEHIGIRLLILSRSVGQPGLIP